MPTLWFILVAWMLIMYVLLDGFDLGAGIIHLVVARTNSERHLVLRPRLPNVVWVSFWDGMFFLGSSLLAIFYGAALGNVIRGVPLNSQGYFFGPLWTDFNPFSANPGILDWYTILTGLLAFAVLLTHGANYIAVKTEGTLNER